MEVSVGRTAIRKAARQVSSIRQYSIVHDVPRTANLGQTPSPPVPRTGSAFDEAMKASGPRNTWTKQEISEIYQKPLMELAYAAVRDVQPLICESLLTIDRALYIDSFTSPERSNYARS